MALLISYLNQPSTNMLYSLFITYVTYDNQLCTTYIKNIIKFLYIDLHVGLKIDKFSCIFQMETCRL